MGDWEIAITAYLFAFIASSSKSLFVFFLNMTALTCDWGGSRALAAPWGEANAEEEKAQSKVEREGGAWGRKGVARGLWEKVQKQFGGPSIRAEVEPEANGHQTCP